MVRTGPSGYRIRLRTAHKEAFSLVFMPSVKAVVDIPRPFTVEINELTQRKDSSDDSDHKCDETRAQCEIHTKNETKSKGDSQKVARDYGRNGIGIEINPDYVEVARQRLA